MLQKVLVRRDGGCDKVRVWRAGRYLFEANRLEAEELRSVKKEHIQKWFDEFLSEQSRDRRKLVIQVWGGKCESPPEEKGSSERPIIHVKSAHEFRKSLHVFPSIHA